MLRWYPGYWQQRLLSLGLRPVNSFVLRLYYSRQQPALSITLCSEAIHQAEAAAAAQRSWSPHTY